MAESSENLEQNAAFPVEEELPESDCGHEPLESPGTKRALHLGTTQFNIDESEAPAKLMERPVSSGCTELHSYTLGAAPKRDLYFPQKHTAALFGVPDGTLNAKSNSGKSIKGNIIAMQTNRRQSSVVQTSSGHRSHERRPYGPSNPKFGPSHKSNASNSDDSVSNGSEPGVITHSETEPDAGPPSKGPSTPDSTRKTTFRQRVEVAPLRKQRPSDLSMAPILRADQDPYDDGRHSTDPAGLSDEKASDASHRVAKIAQISAGKGLVGSLTEMPGVVDLTDDNRRSGQIDVASQSMAEDNSHTQAGAPKGNGHASVSELGQQTPEDSMQGRRSVARESPMKRRPLQPVKQTKVTKRTPIQQQQPSSLPLGISGAPTGSTPSEEDLYYLLLHRYRKREQIEKRLTARLRQLERENGDLCQTAQQTQQQLEASITSGTKQADKLRAQKMAIDEIRNGYLKIKNFMTDVCEDQKILKAKTTSVEKDRQTLRDEHNYLHHSINEAQNATTSSSNTLTKVKRDLAEMRRETAHLEMSLHDARLELRNEQQRLAQEKCRNTKYQNHIVEITRTRDNFNSTVQQGQQHLLNGLKNIKDKFHNLETNQLMAPPPPNLAALDQCVEMLKALTKVETASPADVTDMIQVIQGLTESIDSFERQSEDSSQRAAISRAQSDSNLLSQVTEQFNTLVHDSDHQDQITEMREAKKTLEERVRGNENMLVEVRNSRVSAEKREYDLRAGNEKVLTELAKLREMALTTKKGSGPMTELQQLSMKWTSTNSLLAESLQRIEGKDQKLQGQEEQIRILSDQLGLAKAQQEKSVEEVQKLSKTIIDSADAANRKEGRLLAEKELHIGDLQVELKNAKRDCSDHLKQIEELKSVHCSLERELDGANSRLGQVVRDCTTARSTIDSLNQQLPQIDELREQADRMRSLVHEGEVKDGTVADLQQELGSLKAANQRLHGHQVDAENKVMEIAELNVRLQKAEEAPQQLGALQQELQNFKEQIASSKDARERVNALECELRQKDDRMNQLNIDIADFDDTRQRLNDLLTEMTHCRRDYECIEKTLKVTMEEAARTPTLVKEITLQRDEISELKAKLAEAERISEAVPEMHAQVNQFSETFSNLRRELEHAQEAGEELRSIKTANATFQQRIVELQDQAAVAEQASDSLKCLSEEVQQKDARIVALEIELGRLKTKQQQMEVREASPEDLHDEDVPQETCRLADDSLVQQAKDGYDNDYRTVENETADTIRQEAEPRKERKRANRSVSSLQVNASTSDHLVLVRKTSERAGLMVDAVNETPPANAVDGCAPSVQHLDEANLIPESQPHGNDLDKSLSSQTMRDMFLDDALSSSPLSDVGALFGSTDQDQPAKSRYHATQQHIGQLDDTDGREDVEATEQPLGHEESLLSETSQCPEASHRDRELTKLSQGSRPVSSSYGEPLLLDDLEGLGSLPASRSMNTVPGMQLNPSIQDVLTSPVGTLPRKLPRKSMQPRPTAMPLSGPDVKAAGLIDHVQHLAKGPSPRRLRNSRASPRTNTRGSLHDLGEDTVNVRPATPNLPAKERHQPNSAIKRKSETASIVDENFPTEKKRSKRNLSNMDVASRPGTRSWSVNSSTSARVGETFGRLRQSSISTTSSRNTIVGKKAPASGGSKQRPKKPRGLKSQRYNERFGNQ